MEKNLLMNRGESNRKKDLAMGKTKVICFANNKGGSGKSTTCANVGYGLTQLGKKSPSDWWRHAVESFTVII